MGVFDLRIEWTRIQDKNTTIPILDCVNASINKSTEIKNNIAQLTLKNSAASVAEDGTVIGEYVESDTKVIKFEEDDQFKIWAAILTDASEVGTSWYDDARLLGSFTLEEYQVQSTENQNRIQLKCIDSAFLLFNQIYNFSYGISNTFTAPGIVREIMRKHAEATERTVTTTAGTQLDAGVQYAITANFLSEGGNITDYRSATSTTLNGSITDTDTTITVVSTTGFDSGSDGTIVIGTEHIAYTGVTATTFTGCTRGIDNTEAVAHSDTTTVYKGFPQILMAKSWKPIFEWVGELSQTSSTNYLSEIQEGGTRFYNRAFLFWVDKSNAVHWVYPDDTVDLTIELSEEGRRSFRLEKSVFDAVNFIIYNSGEDMYGNGVIHYFYDDTSEVSSLKMRYQPMSKIVHTLIDEDIKKNPTRDTTNPDIYKQFPDSGQYPVVPSFLDDANRYRAATNQSSWTDADNDTEYNSMLRDAAKWRGRLEAEKIARGRQGLRWSGQIALKGVYVNPGDLVQVTNPPVGMISQNLRVKEVAHQISNNRWETVLSVEEDETAEA